VLNKGVGAWYRRIRFAGDDAKRGLIDFGAGPEHGDLDGEGLADGDLRVVENCGEFGRGLDAEHVIQAGYEVIAAIFEQESDVGAGGLLLWFVDPPIGIGVDPFAGRFQVGRRGLAGHVGGDEVEALFAELEDFRGIGGCEVAGLGADLDRFKVEDWIVMDCNVLEILEFIFSEKGLRTVDRGSAGAMEHELAFPRKDIVGQIEGGRAEIGVITIVILTCVPVAGLGEALRNAGVGIHRGGRER